MIILPTKNSSSNKQKKQRKFGRNKKKCEIYRLYNIRIVNKKRKIKRHLKKYPNDNQAARVLKTIIEG